MVKKILPVLLLLASAPFLPAENIISVEMELYNTVMKTRDSEKDPYWAYGISGTSGLSIESTENRNVRSELSLDFNYPDSMDIPVITLQKAYVKARFPDFRLTVGKTRLGWGDGFVFNSGDVIFGSTSPYVNLIGSEIRTETAWLTSVNYPLGRFSFIEALVCAPNMMLSDDNQATGLGEAKDLGAGMRLYTKVAGIKVETGYYFDGADSDVFEIPVDALHRPYISFQGNFGPDFFINSSLAIPASDGNNLKEVVKDTLNISFGLFYLQEVSYSNSLTFRLESVILPYLDWKEEEGTAGSYALLIYPEVSLALGQTMNVSLRSIFSPIDLSAQFTAGFSWNIFEGFDLLTYATFNGGDGNDTFSWNRDDWETGVDSIDGVSFMTGISYIY